LKVPLQLAGHGERTQESYLRAVRQLAAYTKLSPDQISEDQLRRYLLYLKNEKNFAPGSLKIAYSGIKFFYTHTVKRDWETLTRLRVPQQRKLPAVLSRDEVRQLLEAVQTPHNRAFLQTVYGLGLRLQEGLHLQIGDIDSDRMLVHVHRGKGARDRYVPLAENTLGALREYWKTHRNPTWLFPTTGRDHRQAPTAERPMSESSVQGCLKRVVELPCPYFLLTFTLPASLRRFVRAHPRAGYAAMFRASSETIRTLAADPKYVGSSHCGFFGVLHTWGRTLEYHPHIHYVVPGGGLSDDGTRWLASRADFFIPVKAASRIYRAKFRDAMRQAGLLDQIDPTVWKEAWVVDSQAVGDGERAVKYLAPYVFRVAISDHRIVAIDDGPDGQGRITFGYRKSGSRRWRRMTLTAEEFLRRFLQHVLPKGFPKVRHYGFATAVKRKEYDHVRWLATLAQGETYLLTARSAPTQTVKPVVTCPGCGGPMKLIAVYQFSPTGPFDTS
jgi:site-specific recombinase XerD